MHKRAGWISLLITANDQLNLLFIGLADSLIDAQRFLNEKQHSSRAVYLCTQAPCTCTRDQ